MAPELMILHNPSNPGNILDIEKLEGNPVYGWRGEERRVRPISTCITTTSVTKD